MPTRIRLTRKGAKKDPFYRIVVVDSESPRDGRFIEILGTYDPSKQPFEVKVDQDRLSDWLEKGAKPSETVASLLKRQGVK